MRYFLYLVLLVSKLFQFFYFKALSTIMNGATRKRKSITIEEKLKVINAYDEDEAKNMTAVGGRFNRNRETVRDIIRNREKILQASHGGVDSKRKHLKPPKNNALETTMLNWTKRMRSLNLPLTGDLIKVSFLKDFKKEIRLQAAFSKYLLCVVRQKNKENFAFRRKLRKPQRQLALHLSKHPTAGLQISNAAI
jgi:hypothetical protein